MNKLTFAVLGAASLALAACSGTEEDTVEGVDENVQIEELNALAENAAIDAQTESLENEVQAVDDTTTEETVNTVDENVTDPSQVEEDVQGM